MSNVREKMKEKLAKQLKARAEAREASDSENKKNQNYSEIEWCDIKINKHRIVRLVGLPYTSREESTDSQILFTASFLTDDAKGYLDVIYPLNLDPLADVPKVLLDDRDLVGTFDPNFIHFKIIQEITKTTGVDENKNPIYEHQGSKTLKRLINNKTSFDKFIKGTYPTKRILLNVIDRQDPEQWCKKNKHTKILTTKIDIRQNKKTNKVTVYTDLGIGITLYDKIENDILRYSQHWDLDIVFLKEPKKNSNQYDYTIFEIMDKKVPKEIQELGNDDPLSKEEQKYKLYNFDELYRPTTHQEIHRDLKGLYQSWDAESGSTYLNDLLDEIKREKDEGKTSIIKPELKSKASTPDEDDDEEEEEDVQDRREEEDESQEKSTPKKRRSPKEQVKEEQEEESEELDMEIFKSVFPKYKLLEDDILELLKDSIESFEKSGKGYIPVYKTDMIIDDQEVAVDLGCSNSKCFFPNTKIPTMLPDFVSDVCPVDGANL